ncbi:myelin transcription factor 1-like protein [Panonychus citri]|uniref:myelin transcription factor 1-like protein n=1 Tax=Panonychus citri TaxID=50023 RepID=UPI0023075FD3|nr:myelin transcription factor 1-like protein [Panonychus citri]
MDQCEQLDADDKDQLIECDSELIAGWSSSRRKVESVAEKVAWSSVALVSGDADCELGGDSCGDLNSKVGVTSAVIEASSSKWLSDQQITESFVDDRVDDGEGGSLIVVNRSARRMETHTESIVTRKVRSRIIEIDDGDDFDDQEDEDNDDNSNINSREISRCNSNEENDDNDDESIESDNEVAISIRRPSLSLVKAEAFVFRSRRSLEELETEIVIRKKRKPKVNKEMDETATIFIANCDSTAIKETSSSLSPSSSSSSLPLSSLSMRAIPENRRDNLMESFNKHGSLDTETDSNEDDDEIISEQLDEQSTNCFDHVDKLSQLAGDRFDWNCSPITTVFKSDREINDLF